MTEISEKLKKALLQFNLRERDAEVYFGLLKFGGSSIQDISRLNKINRVTVYESLERLKDAGLVSQTKRGKRNLYLAENPESLRHILEIKKQKLEQSASLLEDLILPSLRAIDKTQEKRPQIKFFEGLAGIYKVYDDYFLKHNEAIAYGSYDSVMKVSSEKQETGFFQKLKERKIFFRSILEETPLNHKFTDLSQGAMHSKFLPEGEKVSADILVFGSTVALISYENLTATLIEDDSISKSIKMFFEFMWERL